MTTPVFDAGAASTEQNVGSGVNDTVAVAVNAGDMIVLFINHFQANISSVTDSDSNSYTSQLSSGASSPRMDVYTARASKTSTVTITVVYAASHNSGLVALAYRNVSGIGAKAIVQDLAVFTSPYAQTLITTIPGSLIVYGYEAQQPGATCVKPYTPSGSQADRAVTADPAGGCGNAINPGVGGELVTTTVTTYTMTESWSVATTRGCFAAIELLPTRLSPDEEEPSKPHRN